MMMQAKVSSVRGGFSYERASSVFLNWIELQAWLEAQVRTLSDENPDRILVSLERPK